MTKAPIAMAKTLTRSSGVLLSATSLPSPYGIGDLGPSAFAWVDALARARQAWWQVLPLGYTGYGDSPYQCFSAYAGNPLLISPELLIQEGLLEPSDVADADFPADRVDYGRVIPFKTRVLETAWRRFRQQANSDLAAPFAEFCANQAYWLDDFALFMSLKESHGGVSWFDWPDEHRLREPNALATAKSQLAERIELKQFVQFLFFRQWQSLKQYARSRGVGFIGDTPIFVASDSADLWTHHELFQLDEDRRPKVVAGVPPDYFAVTGQLWGNPMYDWDAHRQSGYSWWISRLRATLELVDLVRLDHFRGFEAAWEIPAGNPTAEIGVWGKGPGAELFDAVKQALGGLPVIAEDLGLITPEVEALRVQFDLPGMRILQFAFGGSQENRFLPHLYEQNTTVYTGSHDNDTTLGWFESLAPHESRFLRRYAPSTDANLAWDLIRLAWASVADLAVAPLQDVLSLGREARMNTPGVSQGNWQWRFASDMMSDDLLLKLADLTEIYGRSAG